MEKKEQPRLETETDPEDVAVFTEIEKLTEEEGWSFGGHSFEQDGVYHITLRKEGCESKIFKTKEPYRKLFGPKGVIPKKP